MAEVNLDDYWVNFFLIQLFFFELHFLVIFKLTNKRQLHLIPIPEYNQNYSHISFIVIKSQFEDIIFFITVIIPLCVTWPSSFFSHILIAIKDLDRSLIIKSLLYLFTKMIVSVCKSLIPENKFFIIHFDIQKLISNWIFERKQHSPIEGTFATVRSIVNICIFYLAIKLALNIQIHHICHIILLCFYFTTIPNYYPQLKLFIRSCRNVKLLVQINLVKRDEVHPKSDTTLTDSRLLNLQVMSLNWVIELNFTKL